MDNNQFKIIFENNNSNSLSIKNSSELLKFLENFKFNSNEKLLLKENFSNSELFLKNESEKHKLIADFWAKELTQKSDLSLGMTYSQIDERQAKAYRNYEIASKDLGISLTPFIDSENFISAANNNLSKNLMSSNEIDEFLKPNTSSYFTDNFFKDIDPDANPLTSFGRDSGFVDAFFDDTEKNFWNYEKSQNTEDLITKSKELEQDEKLVGKITFHDSGEVMQYNSIDKYLNALEQELESTGIGAFKYETILREPELIKKVDDIIYGEYGLDNPNSIDFYKEKNIEIIGGKIKDIATESILNPESLKKYDPNTQNIINLFNSKINNQNLNIMEKNTEKVKLRIDLPNNEKPFFNRLTSVENALKQLEKAVNILDKKQETLSVKINDFEDNIPVKNIKDEAQKIISASFEAQKINVLTSELLMNQDLFNKNDNDAGFQLAKDYYSAFEKTKNSEFLDKAQDYVQEVLKSDKFHQPAIQLNSKISQINNSNSLNTEKEPLFNVMYAKADISGDEAKILDRKEIKGVNLDEAQSFIKDNLKDSNNLTKDESIKLEIVSNDGFQQTSYIDLENSKKDFAKSFQSNYSDFKKEENAKIEIQNYTSNMSENQKQTFSYLNNSLKFLGFGEKASMQKEMAAAIISQQENFSIAHKSDKGYFKNNDINFNINFQKSNTSDKVFLNSFDVNLKNEKRNVDISQNFNVSKFGFTEKEAVNLMEGRSVKTDLKLKSGVTEKNVFIKLDFNEKNENGNFKTKKFFEKYGVDTSKILEKNNAFFKDQEVKDKVIKSLEKGNVVPLIVKNSENKLQNLNAILSPESKSLQLYNNRMERVNITETISNSAKVEQSTTEKVSQHKTSLRP